MVRTCLRLTRLQPETATSSRSQVSRLSEREQLETDGAKLQLWLRADSEQQINQGEQNGE